MRTRKLSVFAAFAAAAALALAGCSGGVGGGSDGGDSGDGPIKLGMLAPFSGSESAFGPYMKNGAQMAVDEINADGGVLGRQLQLVTEDDACEATTATNGANKLVTAGITASVGGYCSGATLPTLPIFSDAKVPMVIPAANSNELVNQKLSNVFLINGTGTQQAGTALKYAKKIGAQRVALLDDNTDYAKDLTKSFSAQAKDDGGTLQVVLNQSVNPGEKDYSANVNNVIKANPDFLYWTGYYQEGGLITRQLKDAGYKGTVMVADGTVDKKFSDTAGLSYAKDVVGTFTQTPDMLQGADDWVASYKDKFNAEPGPYSTQSYDAVRVVAEGIKNANSTDGDKIVKGLEDIDGMQLFSGPLKFTPEHTLSQGGFAVVTVSDNGNFVLKDPMDS